MIRKKPASAEQKIVIPAPNLKTMKVKVKGTSPLISHRWTQKAMQQIEDIQNKKPGANKREPRDKDREYRDSFYMTRNGEIAFPALNIKNGMVGAVRNLTGVTMSLMKGAIFVLGDEDGLIPVRYKGKPIKLSKTTTYYKDGETPNDAYMGYDPAYPDQVIVRRDPVRVNGGGADLRYRGSVKDWEMEMLIQFNADVVSAEQVLNLLNTAGFACGLGEWRPERNGDYGRYEVAQN